MAGESTSHTRRWAIALAVVVCVPGWLAWMDFIQYTSPAAWTPVPHYAAFSTWQYVVLFGGPVVAVILLAWGMPSTLVRALGIVCGGYLAALCFATFFAFVDTASYSKLFVVLAVGFLVLAFLTAAYSAKYSRAEPPQAMSPRSGPRVADELAKLAALKNSGVISEQEFAAQRTRLLH